jgi:glycosyltransferase involved in cell wall biosynthesis
MVLSATYSGPIHYFQLRGARKVSNESNRIKIKVLHLIESGGMYGAENVILNLSLEMQRSGRYEPIVGSIIQDRRQMPAICDVARNNAIRIEQFHIRNTWLPLDYTRFLRRLKAIGPAIIHSHGYKPSVFAYVAGKFLGIPVTATCHLWYLDQQAPLKMRLMIRLEKAAYRKFPMIFAVSPAIREILLAEGVKDTRIHVVNNGIPLLSPSPGNTDPQVIAGRFGVDAGEVCVVNVGRLTHQKSQKTIIDAASIVRNQGKRYKFLIAGEGELRDELERHVRDTGLESMVRLVGYAEPISELLRIATVFVLPSHDEGMPMSLLEAVACRVPVVATNVGAIGNIIKDKVSGLIISRESPAELARAIEEIVDNPGQSKALSDRAFELLESSYSSAAMFKAYDHYYRMILSATNAS